MRTPKKVILTFKSEEVYQDFYNEIIEEFKQAVKGHPEYGTLVENDSIVEMHVDSDPNEWED